MNDNDLRYEFDNNDTNNDNTYRARTNLNTAIENPDVNINSVMGVNIQNIDASNSQNNLEQSLINNDINTQVYTNSQSFMNNNNVDLNINNKNQYQAQFIEDSVSNNNINPNMSFDSYDDISSTDNLDSNVRYEPTLKTKKKPSSEVVIAKEIKAMFVIVLVLLLFIFVVPYIYDFFREMDLVITN